MHCDGTKFLSTSDVEISKSSLNLIEHAPKIRFSHPNKRGQLDTQEGDRKLHPVGVYCMDAVQSGNDIKHRLEFTECQRRRTLPTSHIIERHFSFFILQFLY